MVEHWGGYPPSFLEVQHFSGKLKYRPGNFPAVAEHE